MTTESQAEINPETNVVLRQLNLSVSRQDDCRLGYTVTYGHAADSAIAGDYGGLVLDLSSVALEEIATALADQAGCEHRWLINPETGEVVFWAAGTGIDGQAPIDPDELDLICIDPVLSRFWYQDMADFADQISDEGAGRRLARAIQGHGRLPLVQSRDA